MVKVQELREGKLSYICLDVVEKGVPREMQNKESGEPFSVVLCKGKDDTGEVLFSAWNNDISKFNVGDKVEIIHGFVNRFQDQLHITTGRFGFLNLIKR